MRRQLSLLGAQPTPSLSLHRLPVPTLVGGPHAKPLLKWAGGKTNSLPRLLARLPPIIEGAYIEPMVGAGALFWALRRAGALRGPVILADLNPRLIACWRGVQADAEQVIRLLQGYRAQYESAAEATFYEARRAFNEERMGDVAMAALMIFLNKTCMNGLYRESKSGVFNVSWCRDPRRNFLDENRLRACAAALAGVQLVCADVADVVAFARAGDVVYLDPPYVPTSETADFTAYTADGFDDEDQIRVRDLIRGLHDRGVLALASNADVPMAWALYDGFRVERTEARRAINVKGALRGKVGELLILPPEGLAARVA